MNKRLKVIFSLLSATVILFSSISAFAYVASIEDVPYEADETEAGESLSGSGLESAFDLLSYLGICDESRQDIKIGEQATKAQAAKYFGRIRSAYKNANPMHFDDVDAASAAYQDIRNACENGAVISGGNFYPNAKIKPIEAADMAMRVVGYDKIYTDAALFASDKGIFKGVDISGDTLTIGDIIRIIENTLVADALEVNYQPDNSSIKISDKSYLEKVYNITVQRGIVTGVAYSSLYADSKTTTDDNRIEINRGIFECYITPNVEWVGKNIRAYVDVEDEKKVISVWEYKNTTKDIEFSDIADISPKLITDKDNKKYKISETAKALYNGTYYAAFKTAADGEKLDDYDRLTLIDNDNDGEYDVVKIKKAQTYLVKSVSVFSERIDLKYGYESIELDGDNIVNITMNGEKISYEQLGENMALSVYQAKTPYGTEVLDIYASDEMITEVLETADKNDAGQSVYVLGGKEYILSENFIAYLEKDSGDIKPTAGKESTFILTYDGKIAGIVAESAGFSYGWMMSSYQDEITEKCYVTIYLTDGSTEKFVLRDNVKYYDKDNQKGKRIKDYQVIESIGTKDTLIYDVVAYKASSSGEISELALPIDYFGKRPGTTEYPLTKNYTSNKADDRCYRNIYQSKYIVGGVTAISYPTNKSDRTNEKQFSVSKMSYQDKYFGGTEITIYNVDSYFKAGLVTMGETVQRTVSMENVPCVISKIYKGTDENDEESIVFECTSGTETIEKILADDCTMSSDKEDNNDNPLHWYGSPDSVSKLSVGDIIQFQTDGNGKINSIRCLFKMDNPAPFGVQDSKNGTLEGLSSMKVIHGRVADYDAANCIHVNIAAVGEEDNIIPVFTTSTIYGKNTYVLYEKKGKKVSVISRNEMKAGDEIVIRRRYEAGVNMFIIR